VSFRIIGASLLTLSALAFCETLVMRPGAEGKDATLFSRADAVEKNFGDAVQIQAGTWTWNGDGLGQGTYRGLIAFDLGAVPAGAVIKSAKLDLYCDTINYTKGHSSLSESNAAYLMRVKDAWAESTVTWKNQPEADTAGRIELDSSKNAIQNYSVDVTAMVAVMAADSSKNHGFLFRSVSEATYNAMVFGSGDNKDSSLHPRLEVEYELPTRAGKTLADLRTKGETPKYRISAGELILPHATAGELIDLHGKVVTRFEGTAVVALDGLKSGAYILSSEGRSARVFVP
jgi:hypothetical protein